MKNKMLLLVSGQLSLAICLFLNFFMEESNTVLFLLGFFTGLAIVFNLAYIVSYSKKKKE